MRSHIYASFNSIEAARNAAGALLDHGANKEDMSLVLADSPNGSGELESADRGITMTTGADAASGATKGAGLGLGIGALAALASVIVPGVGIVLGGGALAAAIGGAAATTAAGALAGGVTGYLKDQGVPDDLAISTETKIRAGGALLSIVVPSGDLNESLAMTLLNKYGETGHEVWTTDPFTSLDVNREVAQ